MRKVLSFVLVLSLVLSSFSMAFAADTSAGLTDINGNVNEDAIQVAYDLEIVTGNPDGTFLPDKAVNRAEFAAMLTRALAIPDSALVGYTATSFKDTAGYTWAVAYLAFCQSKGILLGDGAGNVMPGRTITVNEAMTMALRAIGYTANSSLLVGSWPSNYVSIAQNEDLYEDVSKDTVVNKANAAQIIYNLLTVQKVAVDSDGSTEFLWIDDDKDEGAQNILNTNLDCTEYEDEILGSSGFSYDDAIINITGKLGAFGDAYLNDDDELIAFTVDDGECVQLTGEINDGLDTFTLTDDTEYDISNSDNEFTTDGAFFYNGDYSAAEDCEWTIDDDSDGKISVEDIYAFAEDYSDDGATVILNCDVSGKTINDIYSVVAWKATDDDQVDSDVQEDIADNELVNTDFDEDDDGNIDMNSFELVGISSLDKIAEDDIVYVYESDDDDVIRRVGVGTETVEGVVDEVDEDDAVLTIGGKDYDLAPEDIAEVTIDDFDTDSDGIFYLDYSGDVYDYDGSAGSDAYGIIEEVEEEGIDNFQVKLYTYEDSTETYEFSDDMEDMDWTSEDAIVTEGALYDGNLIGYSLDANGDIDEVDSRATSYAAVEVDIQSAKVLKLHIGSKWVSYDIADDAVVFEYKDTSSGAIKYDDPTDVLEPDEIDTGVCQGYGRVFVLYDEDDEEVKAIYLSDANTDDEDDDIYGVINKRTKAKNDDGDEVFKYVGFIDGASFTYKTDTDCKKDNQPAGRFGVYAFTLDSANAITEIKDLTEYDYYDTTYNPDGEESGYIALDILIDDLSSDKTTVTDDKGNKYTVDEDAVVYRYDEEDEEFFVEKLSSLRKGYTASLFDCKGDDADGSASVVIYIED